MAIDASFSGRSFKRTFDKKHYPLLGDDPDKSDDPEAIYLSGRRGKEPKKLSVSVPQIRDLLRDPETGKWKWPLNGADEVYPGIFLGDG